MISSKSVFRLGGTAKVRLLGYHGTKVCRIVQSQVIQEEKAVAPRSILPPFGTYIFFRVLGNKSLKRKWDRQGLGNGGWK
jgi:hypothetical protein